MTLKKILSLLVVMTILLSSVGITVMAEETSLTDSVVFPDGITAENYQESFGEKTVTDGKGNYYDTLKEAVTANGETKGAVLYCKPDSDVGTMQHGHVCKNLTVYGNGATVSGAVNSERDFEIGVPQTSCTGINEDITLTVYNLNGVGAWGNKTTEHTVNINFVNCKEVCKIFISGTTGQVNISLTDCTYTSNIHGDTAVYSNADGEIELTNCTFTGVTKAVNLNHKATGTQTVNINGCTFTNCGNDVSKDQIPVRILSSVEGGETVTTITACSFSGTPVGGADILLDYGVGTTTASISGTDANVSVEKENNVPTNTTVTASKTFVVSNNENSAPVAMVGEITFSSVLDALQYAIDNSAAEIKILADTREVMPTDFEIIINADLAINADNPVKVEFYNDGTNYDFVVGSNNDNKLTIGENVHFDLVDRVIWLGYYGNNVKVQVDGYLGASQIWHGANTTVSETGTLDSHGEALVMRRGALLTVDGGKIDANYFNILSGQIMAENNAEINCGAFWIANTGSYAGEGNVLINIWDSTLNCTGNIKTVSDNDVYIDVYNSTVDIKLHDGVPSQIGARTNIDVNGENAVLNIKNVTNEGKISVYDGGSVNIDGTLTNNGTLESSGNIYGVFTKGADTAVFEIAGGTYDHNPTEYVADGYVALKNMKDLYVVGKAPTATVTNEGAIIVPGKGYTVYNNFGDATSSSNDEDMPLPFVMQYVANESAEEGAASPYADWYGDFVITITGLSSNSFEGDGCYLAGHYGSFGWVKVPIDSLTIENGVRYPIMLSTIGSGQKYEYICGGVDTFKCALYLTPEVLAANPDMQVNLELCVVDNSAGGAAAQQALATADSPYTYQSAVKTFEEDDFEAKVASVTDAEGNVTNYATLKEAIAATNAGDTITVLENIELSEAVTVAKDMEIVLDLNGKTITYNSTVQGEAMITNKGNLTINDSVGTGIVNYYYTGVADPSYGKGNYTISNAGTLTVNGGKITIANLSGHAKYPIDNNSTTGDAILVVNGGHLYNYNTSAIRQFCNSTTYKNSVTINGGLIEGYSAIWMQNPGANTVNGSLSVTGGEIRSTAKAYVNGTSELKDVNSNIYCTIYGEGGAWSEDSAVSITGGTFNENVYLATNAPETISVNENAATFNGRLEIPESVELFEFAGSNVKLGNSLAMNFAIDADNIDGTDYYAEIKHYADTESEPLVVPFANWEKDGENYYKITYTGITAKQIADKIEITIYKTDGTQVSKKREDGMRAYALRMLEKATTNDELKTTLVDMLNYGAAAQLQFGYKTDELANAGIDKYASYASEMPVITNEREMDENLCAGSSLILKDNIKMNVAFRGITEGMTATVSYTKHDEAEERTYNYTYEDFEENNEIFRVLTIDTLVIADAKQLITVTVYNPDGSVYTTVKDSMNSYLARQINTESTSKIFEMTAKFTSSAYNTLH